MAHHPYNATHMVRHVEWTKTAASTLDMLPTTVNQNGTVSMSAPIVSAGPIVTAPAGTCTTMQWPAAASELCEVVLTECLRQQHQAAMAAAAAQQNVNQSVVTSTSTIAITQEHEVPTLSTVTMDEVLRADLNALGASQTILAPGTTLTLPVQVVSTVTTGKSRRCPHHHHHHYQHANSPLQQEKIGYAPYRYRLPSSDLLPNHEELVAAGAIPASPPQTLVITTQPAQLQQSPPPPASTITPELEPPTQQVAATQTPNILRTRKPRASRSKSKNNNAVKKPPVEGPPAAPAPVTSTSTFPCPDCGKKFLWASRLVVHRRSHTGEKPFPCTQCGAAFAQRWLLAVHMKTHNPPEPEHQEQVTQHLGNIHPQLVRPPETLIIQHVEI